MVAKFVKFVDFGFVLSGGTGGCFVDGFPMLANLLGDGSACDGNLVRLCGAEGLPCVTQLEGLCVRGGSGWCRIPCFVFAVVVS